MAWLSSRPSAGTVIYMKTLPKQSRPSMRLSWPARCPVEEPAGFLRSPTQSPARDQTCHPTRSEPSPRDMRCRGKQHVQNGGGSRWRGCPDIKLTRPCTSDGWLARQATLTALVLYGRYTSITVKGTCAGVCKVCRGAVICHHNHQNFASTPLKTRC